MEGSASKPLDFECASWRQLMSGGSGLMNCQSNSLRQSWNVLKCVEMWRKTNVGEMFLEKLWNHSVHPITAPPLFAPGMCWTMPQTQRWSIDLQHNGTDGTSNEFISYHYWNDGLQCMRNHLQTGHFFQAAELIYLSLLHPRFHLFLSLVL